ncbi:hypothetical protein BJP34_29465 [Moorena producens PAL-8-15-08-1]|uniref:Phytanoyl-CoA dioxygenase n=1 Tax=Moorena producens PAL-8-15-08-1 TaxID=1458985 RepID=A0A1D8TZN3_9CYAN|nr:phytanoyl-CoA dioxygenase family protein [Moorena producens]AOX03024.1 hypothetical protein BJP34_29465 [Moorena producens PAL-8-15-08-1]
MDNESVYQEQINKKNPLKAERLVQKTMISLVNLITFSQEEIRSFSETGAIKLKNILTTEATDHLRKLTTNSRPREEFTKYSTDFEKLVYDIDKDITYQIYSSPNFKDTFRQLVPQELTFTQSLGFELTPKKKGAAWHLDTISFSYIMPEDLGYTLWIPLDPINTREQHGGIAYVPRKAYSGDAYFSLLYQLVKNGKIDEVCQLEDFNRFNFQYASQMEELALESCKVEHDLEVGDALLFDKYVWHKSCPLKEGVLPSRKAYVMRLIGSHSHYSKMFLDGMYSLIRSTGEEPQTLFGYKALAHLKDGDPISEDIIART